MILRIIKIKETDLFMFAYHTTFDPFHDAVVDFI